MDIEKFRVNIQPTLEWLKAGAPHSRVGIYNNVGFDMDYIVNENAAKDYSSNPCGTTCCIAGHVALYTGNFRARDIFHDSGEHLGLTGVEMYHLFCATGSDIDLEDITPEMAVRTIEYAMETGKIIWDFDNPVERMRVDRDNNHGK